MQDDELSFEDEFANEFGGRWHEHDDKLVGTFEDAAYAEKLADYFDKFATSYEMNRHGNEAVITVLKPSRAMECAYVVCDKFRKPENGHVTVKGIIERFGFGRTGHGIDR
ncbi:MAG: hypothetical protein ACKVOE_04570 [Rickettsiales bacterium]